MLNSLRHDGRIRKRLATTIHCTALLQSERKLAGCNLALDFWAGLFGCCINTTSKSRGVHSFAYSGITAADAAAVAASSKVDGNSDDDDGGGSG